MRHRRSRGVIVAIMIVVAVVALLASAVWLVLPRIGRQPPETPGALPSRYSHEGLVRGVYGRDSSDSGLDHIAGAGFNAVTVMPDTGELERLKERGLRGVVWLGGYDNKSCSFEHDDSWVRTAVGNVKGHPAVLAYQVGDEPNEKMCPQAPSQIRARAGLVDSIDPTRPTYVVVPAWDGEEAFPYEHFAGTTDVMGLDVYPCTFEHGCSFGMIDRAISEAEKDGVDHYWGILQGFETDWYRAPTRAELTEQFARWDRSEMEGFFVYQWSGGTEFRDKYQDVFERVNG